jgi:hypothetical protein
MAPVNSIIRYEEFNLSVIRTFTDTEDESNSKKPSEGFTCRVGQQDHGPDKNINAGG